MNLFSQKQPKVIRENKEDTVTFSIQYYKSKTSEEYKKELFKKIIGSSVCMAIINTKFMYQEQKIDYNSSQQELLSRLDNLGIDYKRISTERKDEVVIFGLLVKQSDNKFHQDYIIGLIVESHNFEAIGLILDSYNLYYYIDCGICSADELLDRFEASFDDENKLRAGFKYVIFDDNFMENMVVYCKNEDAEHISNILDV